MITVEVVYCPVLPTAVDLVALELPEGATVADAVAASGLLQRHGLDAAEVPLGIWGRRTSASQVLRERDRVELYRPLLCDPKEARRLRYRQKKDRLNSAAAAKR